MKLTTFYKGKYCPYRPPYVCDGYKCAKFASCMIGEINAFYLTSNELNDLRKELREEIGCKQ